MNYLQSCQIVELSLKLYQPWKYSNKQTTAIFQWYKNACHKWYEKTCKTCNYDLPLTFGVAQLELREKFPDLVPDVKLSKHGCVRAT